MNAAPSRSDLANDSHAVVIGQQRMVRPELRFKSATNEWPTPDTLWKPLDDEFGFTLDVCSTHENAKCANHYTLAEDGLAQPWAGVAWMNPPYGAQLARWVKKCHDEAKRGVLVVGLIPVRSNTSYWHDYIMGNEIRFVRGYPKFGNAKQGLKAPLAVVVWRPNILIAESYETFDTPQDAQRKYRATREALIVFPDPRLEQEQEL